MYSFEVRTLCEQIWDGFVRSGWTMQELVERSGLPLDRTSLRLKIAPKKHKSDRRVALRTSEAEACASALGITIAWAPTAPVTKKAS
jgi:hypothetical protein